MHPPSPTYELALLDFGRTALQLNRRDEAVAALQRLVEVDPRNNEGRYLLGMAYITHNEPAKARDVLDKLIADGPNGRAYYARALANFALKRKPEALSDIDEAIRLAPGNPSLAAWRAKILAMP